MNDISFFKSTSNTLEFETETDVNRAIMLTITE